MSTATDITQQISLVEPLPGFGDTEYTLEPIDSRGLLHSLRSVHDPAVRFVLVAASAFFPDYLPEFADGLAGPLGSDDVDVMLVLTVGDSLRAATANLRAPIIFAPQTRRALQVVLDDDSLSMTEPLIAA